MKNQELAKILYDIARYLAMDKVPFKPYAYEKVALAIESLEEDIEKIKSIPRKASKLKIFLNYLIQIRTGNEMEKEELMKYLRVDDKMLRKMKSVLLRKCYDALAPNDGIELLDLLSRYRLVENFKRELVLQELKIKSNKSLIRECHHSYDLAVSIS